MEGGKKKLVLTCMCKFSHTEYCWFSPFEKESMRLDIDNWGNGIRAPKSTPVGERVKESLARLEVLVFQNSEAELASS